MTHVRLHGILAREFGHTFPLNVGNSKDVLHALDANNEGFIARIVNLQKEGCLYEIIIDKKRVNHTEELQNRHNPTTIDLVPAVAGSGIIAVGSLMLGVLGSGTFLAALAKAVLFAAISYALSPKPEVEQMEITADASKESLIFSNTVNTASQGAPLPIGYGRLKVGSQVVQATIKSFPQSQKTRDALRPDGEQTNTLAALRTNKVTDQ
jgi:predicted phage tail protein